jgi:CheY-like chemotaxis protein
MKVNVMYKILIVDDESMYHQILKALLTDYELAFAECGDEALQMAPDFQPDLVLMDIEMPGIDGYETCRRLRLDSATSTIPILFLSSHQDLEDRLKAYGSGGNDYLAKPFDNDELTAKIGQHLAMEQAQKELANQLQSSYSIIMDLQQTSAQVQLISRFVQSGLYCHDISSLTDLFFRTIKGMNSHVVARVQNGDEVIVRSDSGAVNALESEILEMAGPLGRIYPFGTDRAIYNWEHVTLLVKQVGKDIDNLAILLDAFEAGIKAINTESRLLNEVKTLEARNDLIKDEISDLSSEMNSNLVATFLSMGLVAQLEPEEEDRLTDFVQLYNDKINEKLSQLSKNNRFMIELIDELRTPPAILQDAMDADEQQQDDDGGISFF